MPNTELSILVSLKEQVTKDLNRINAALSDAQDASRRFAVGLGVAAGAIGTIGGLALKAASDIEQTKISFTTMLGSAEKADAFVRDLIDFAKKTPFELQGLQDASKQLLAFGFTQNEVIPNLKALGDIASGVGMDKLPNLILAFGQVRAATKLTGGDLRQFTEAGVPLLAQLAANFHTTAAEIQEMVSKGKIGFADVQKALMDMSKEGGKFNNLMENQSKSLGGMVSNLKDAWAQFLTQEGMRLIEWAKQVVTLLVDIVQNRLPAWIDAIQRAGTALASNKEALIIIAGAIVGALIPAVLGVVQAFAAWVAVLGPFALIGAAIAALVALVIDLWQTNERFRTTVIAVWNAVSSAIRDAVDTVKKAIEPVLPALEAMFDSLVGAVKELWGAFTDLWKLLEPLLKPVLEILGRVTIALLIAALYALAAALRVIVEVVTVIIQIFTTVVSWIREQIGAVSNLSGVWQSFGALWDEIMKRISGVGAVWSGIMDTVRSATEQAFDAIKSKVDSVISFVESALNRIKSAYNSITSFASSAVSGLGFGGARATGGPVSGGTAYLVGENGPELFVPSTSGSIIANSVLGSPVGVGGGVNVTVTGNTISSDLDMRKLADSVGQEIVKRLRQNGRY